MVMHKICCLFTVIVLIFLEKGESSKISGEVLENAKTKNCSFSASKSKTNENSLEELNFEVKSTDSYIIEGIVSEGSRQASANISGCNIKECHKLTEHIPTKEESARNSTKREIQLSSRQRRIMTELKVGIAFTKKARSEGYKVTTPKENPYAVLLIMFNGKGKKVNVCSGSLLTLQWVLTAARCFKDFGEVHHVMIYAGGNSEAELMTGKYANGSQVRNSSEIKINPDYRRDLYKRHWLHNLALVRTQEKFVLSETVRNITIPSTPWRYKGYTPCKFTGYGRLWFNTTLHPLTAVDYTRKTHSIEARLPCQCKLVLASNILDPDFAICARFQQDFGICGGDEGAGLVCSGELMGVASAYVMMREESRSSGRCDVQHNEEILECATASTLSFFEDLCRHLEWINNHTHLYLPSDLKKCRSRPEPTASPDTASLPLPGVALWLAVLLLSLVQI